MASGRKLNQKTLGLRPVEKDRPNPLRLRTCLNRFPLFHVTTGLIRVGSHVPDPRTEFIWWLKDTLGPVRLPPGTSPVLVNPPTRDSGTPDPNRRSGRVVRVGREPEGTGVRVLLGRVRTVKIPVILHPPPLASWVLPGPRDVRVNRHTLSGPSVIGRRRPFVLLLSSPGVR